MKTIGEKLNGQYVLLDCPLCNRKWSQKVIFGRTLKCDKKKCCIKLSMQQASSGDILTTFFINPKKVNAAAIQANIISKKIKKDLETNDYTNTIN